MNYQEFIGEMKQVMEQELGNSYQVEVRKIPGFNGQEKTGVTISEKPGQNQIVPVIYLEESALHGCWMAKCKNSFCLYISSQVAG